MIGIDLKFEDHGSPALLRILEKVEQGLYEAMPSLVASLIQYTVSRSFSGAGSQSIALRTGQSVLSMQKSGHVARGVGEVIGNYAPLIIPSLRAHEFGFKGEVKVKEYRHRGYANIVLGKKRRTGTLVHAHKRMLDIRARHIISEPLLARREDVGKVAEAVVARTIAEESQGDGEGAS